MSITNTVSVSEARANFTKIGRQVSETRKSVTVFKGSTPYLVISPAPLAKEPNEETLEAFRELEEKIPRTGRTKTQMSSSLP